MKKILFILLCLLLVGVSGAQTITGQSVSLYTASTGSSILTLDTCPSGLSGYNMTITLSNTTVANIKSVSFPSWAVVNTYSTLPGSSVTILALDTGNLITSSSSNVPMATITFNGLVQGTSNIQIVVNEFDSDTGGAISTSTVNGTLTVTGTAYPEMPTASVTVAPVDTSGYIALKAAIGTDTGMKNESQASEFNFSGIVEAVMSPVTGSALGPAVAWFLLLSIPFIMLWIAQDSAIIPLILGVIGAFGLIALGWVPAEYILPIEGFMGLSIAGFDYQLR